MDRDNGTIKDLNGICILNVTVSEIYSEYYIVYNSIAFVQASPMQVIFRSNRLQKMEVKTTTWQRQRRRLQLLWRTSTIMDQCFHKKCITGLWKKTWQIFRYLFLEAFKLLILIRYFAFCIKAHIDKILRILN